MNKIKTVLVIKENNKVMMRLDNECSGAFTYTNKYGWKVTIKIPSEK